MREIALSFGDQLRLLRRKLGLSQQELAQRLGYTSPAFVSRWENGRTVPRRGHIAQLADSLNLDPLEASSLLAAAGYSPPAALEGNLGSLTDQVSIALSDLRTGIRELREALVSARSFRPDTLDRFAWQASELWMAGSTLHFLPLQFEAFLTQLLYTGAQMTFVITHPRLTRRSPVFKELQSRVSPAGRSIKDELVAAVRLFRRLRARSRQPDQVVVRGSRQVLSMGLTVVNPFSADTRARISLYFHEFNLPFDPAIDFYRSIPGDDAYIYAAIRHFQTLAAESERVL